MRTLARLPAGAPESPSSRFHSGARASKVLQFGACAWGNGSGPIAEGRGPGALGQDGLFVFELGLGS